MMLRRKLVFILSSLVALLLVTAVGAIWSLQGILRDLHHLDTEAWQVIDATNELATSVSMVEIELYQIELSRQRHLDRLIELVESMQRLLERVRTSYVPQLPQNRPLLDAIVDAMPRFRERVGQLATAQDAGWAAQRREEAQALALVLRRDIVELNQRAREHGAAEQRELTAWFRALVLGLSVVFILVINISILAMMRMASLVLRPVEKLLEATRELGHERFDYRVEVDQHDEFDELARAYNSMAAQLQTSEQRKLEMLGQVALTLNHELNNAIAIIEMQLQILSRQSVGNSRAEACARQIHESLARMTRTVDLLKRVRRIVLTDYVSGVKMLDLERSVESDSQDDAQTPAAGHNTSP